MPQDVKEGRHSQKYLKDAAHLLAKRSHSRL